MFHVKLIIVNFHNHQYFSVAQIFARKIYCKGKTWMVGQKVTGGGVESCVSDINTATGNGDRKTPRYKQQL